MKAFLKLSVLALVFFSLNVFSQVDYTLQQNSSALGKPPVAISPGTSDASRNGTFCDDFNIPNTEEIPGWTAQTGIWQVYNNMLETPNYPQWEYITVDGSSQADGCITGRAIYGSPVQLKFVGLIARYANTGSHLMLKLQDNDPSGLGDWNSYWLYIGNSTVVDWGTGNFGTDAIFQMEYTGSNVTIRIDPDRDGTWDFTKTVTVSFTSAGLCGVSGYNNAFMDDYCCGPDCSVAIVPVSNFGIYLALLLAVGFVVFLVYRRA
jgi:hypothetical protein